MIIVLGSVNLDQIGQVAHLPAPGETVSGQGFVVAPGGKGANQALAAARAGAGVRQFGAVGRDTFADQALALLRAGGVDLSGVAAHADSYTGIALILVDAAGENVIAVMPGANGEVDAAAAAAALQGAGPGDVLLLQNEIPREANLAALRLARAQGVTSILNIAPYLEDRAADADLADVLVANETEFTALTGPGDLRANMVRRWRDHPQDMIVTLGAKGALVLSGGVAAHVPAYPVDPVDTVGAGDTFCGYLAAGLGEGLDLVAATRRAVVAGSLACLTRGAQPSIPMAADVAAIAGAPAT